MSFSFPFCTLLHKERQRSEQKSMSHRELSAIRQAYDSVYPPCICLLPAYSLYMSGSTPPVGSLFLPLFHPILHICYMADFPYGYDTSAFIVNLPCSRFGRDMGKMLQAK
ncbi:hypothetical protein bpr_II181 (plasmid) [Butyrivibrio proteoclasticus B316]|uniref:Uncharacterized protein n=1 Tax=Butyrivibrio proteoclasticus (strain ATCC 51982 / DSM 14932 / B316) TaxID=515622 RepID=E0S3Y7_BUTPB|nr:hypothetical protein bpr_II181 [Butyrivibrio proteoclasticus B316]